MIVALGANYRGHVVQDIVARFLESHGHALNLWSPSPDGAAEYPEVAAGVARMVQDGLAERGILIGRTGIGMSIVANKFIGVRAAVCYDEVTAETARRFLDVNVLCLSAELIGRNLLEAIVQIWLATPFDGGRHARRIERVTLIEQFNGTCVGDDI